MKPVKLTELGRALRLIRIDAGLRLKDMAGLLGTSAAYLSAVEYGRKRPTRNLLDRLVEKCGLDRNLADKIFQESRCPICGRLKATKT